MNPLFFFSLFRQIWLCTIPSSNWNREKKLHLKISPILEKKKVKTTQKAKRIWYSPSFFLTLFLFLLFTLDLYLKKFIYHVFYNKIQKCGTLFSKVGIEGHSCVKWNPFFGFWRSLNLIGLIRRRQPRAQKRKENSQQLMIYN